MQSKQFNYLQQPPSLYKLQRKKTLVFEDQQEKICTRSSESSQTQLIKKLLNLKISQINITKKNQNLKNSERRIIFYNCQYTLCEKEQIRAFKVFIEKQNMQVEEEALDDQILCRFLQSENFNFAKALKKLIVYVEWMHDLHIQNLVPKTKKLLQSGCIYAFGRDFNDHPVIYLRLDLINLKKYSLEDYYAVFNKVVSVVSQYLFVKGKIEQYTIVIDQGAKYIFTLPVDLVVQIIQKLASVYPMYLHKMLVINTSKFSKIIHTTVKKLIPQGTMRKIVLLEGKQIGSLKKQINSKQLQQKFSGEHQNLKTFWPPSLPSMYAESKNDEKVRNNEVETQQFEEDKSLYYSIDASNEFFPPQLQFEDFQDSKNQKCCMTDKECRIF